MSSSDSATFDEDYTLKTPTGRMIDTTSFKDLQATPHADKPDLGKKISNQSRKDVAQAMNSEMLVCDIMPFLANYGPSPDIEISQDVLNGCKKYLLGQEILKKQGNDWSWTGFPTSPTKSQKTESEAFDPLAEIVKGIWNYAEKVQKKKNHPYKFQMVPKSHINASIPGTNHMMDACVVEASYKNLLVTNNSIMPWEMKTKWTQADQIQVREQIVGDSHHILCDDPRRMFIYGATIENDRISFYYFSRSHSVKAFAFPWLSGEGIDTFIRVMLAFAYATPEGWGLDPQVYKPARLDTEDGQRYVYIFEVDEDFNPTDGVSAEHLAPAKEKSKEVPLGVTTRARQARPIANNKKYIYYRTIRGRVPMRPICITGRTTRVWEVIQVRALADPTPVAGAVPVILKDVWLDALSETEADNQDAIFRSVDEFVADGLRAHPGQTGLVDFINSESRFKHFNNRTKERLATLLTAKNYRNLFLTQVLAWQGAVTKPLDEQNASRPSRPIFMQVNTDGKSGDQNLTSRATPSNLTVPQTAVVSAVPLSATVIARREYSQKRQFRVIYKEVCNEIYDVKTFGDVVNITRQALDALQILLCAGWVHRDISTGNILAIPVKNESGDITSWKVKLSDLEFSRHLSHMGHQSDPRTGTPYFMPVEIMSRQYFAREFYTVAAINNMELVRDEITDEEPMPPTPNNLADKYLALDHPHYAHYAKFRDDPNLLAFTELPEPYSLDDIPERYVRHNYQHDLESIWWMLLYFLTACTGSIHAQVFSKTIFLRRMDPEPRGRLFEKESFETTLYGLVQRPLKRVFTGPLNKLRATMYAEYIRRAICGQMALHEAYSFIHAQFAEQLDAILDDETGNWKDMQLIRLEKQPHHGEQASYPLETNKRGADDDMVADVATKKARNAR